MSIFPSNYICSSQHNFIIYLWITVSLQQCTVLLPICHPTTDFEHTAPKTPSLTAQIQHGRQVLSLHFGSLQWFFLKFNWWYIFFFFFPFLLHSLRVNLDMGKIVYSWVIRRDSKIPGTVVRSSTIPEQLGRISYLLTDKTGICVENNSFESCYVVVWILLPFWPAREYNVRFLWTRRNIHFLSPWQYDLISFWKKNFTLFLLLFWMHCK